MTCERRLKTELFCTNPAVQHMHMFVFARLCAHTSTRTQIRVGVYLRRRNTHVLLTLGWSIDKPPRSTAQPVLARRCLWPCPWSPALRPRIGKARLALRERCPATAPCSLRVLLDAPSSCLPWALQARCCRRCCATVPLHGAWDPAGSSRAGAQEPEFREAPVFTAELRDFLPEGNGIRL